MSSTPIPVRAASRRPPQRGLAAALIATATATATATAAALPAWAAQPPAAPPVQAPGLWEHRFSMSSPDARVGAVLSGLQAQLAGLPPEQRRRLDELLAGRGIALGAQGTSAQSCLSAAQAARGGEPQLPGDCRVGDLARQGPRVTFRVACTRPQPMQGDGEVTFSGDKAYSGSANVTAQVGGTAQPLRIETNGRWVGSDCGGVAPTALPVQ